jgi:hypothetical protein
MVTFFVRDFKKQELGQHKYSTNVLATFVPFSQLFDIRWPTSLRTVLFQIACPKALKHLNHKLTVVFYIHVHYFLVLQSAIGCLPVCYLLSAACYLLLACLLYPTMWRVTFLLCGALNPGSSSLPGRRRHQNVSPTTRTPNY